MSLVSCRECGQQVSDRARTCPHCGIDSPAAKASKTPSLRATDSKSLVGMLALLFIAALAGKLLGGIFFVVGGIALLVFSIGIYFLPSFIAIDRDHPNTISIIVINLLFGWTLIGWLICLVWAFSSPRR